MKHVKKVAIKKYRGYVLEIDDEGDITLEGELTQRILEYSTISIGDSFTAELKDGVLVLVNWSDKKL